MVKGYRPKDLTEALQLRAGQEVVPYAGGTDWMVTRDDTKTLLFLNGIPKLKEITEEQECYSLGAGVTFTELLSSEGVPALLKEAVREIASPAIRNAGTLGGNICNASPAGDTLPVLYAMDAKLVIRSLECEKIVPIEEFITGPKRNLLGKTELLERILLPKNKASNSGNITTYYKKIGARKAEAISKLSFVGILEREGDTICSIACAFGAVGPTVVRDRRIEALLAGKTLEEAREMKEEILSRYSEIIRPIDDQRSTAVYRKKVALNLLRDFLDFQ